MGLDDVASDGEPQAHTVWISIELVGSFSTFSRSRRTWTVTVD
jgi:hypothetical protein